MGVLTLVSPVGSLSGRSSPERAPKRRDSLRLEILSCRACLPLLDRNLFGPLFNPGLPGLHIGRLLDDAGGLYLLLGYLGRRCNGHGYHLRVGDEGYVRGERDVSEGEVLVQPEVRDVERHLLRDIAW